MTTIATPRGSVKPSAPIVDQLPDDVPCGRNLRAAMTGLGHPECNILAAASWRHHRGTVAGCPLLSKCDWQAIDAAAARDELEREVDAETPPASWPAWTDEYRWALGPAESDDQVEVDDRAWWAQNAPSNAVGYTVRRASAPQLEPCHRMPVEAYNAQVAMTLGLIPVALAEGIMARSLVGHNA